jgi:hypothetical protein
MTDIRRLLSGFAPGVVVLPGVPLLLLGVVGAEASTDLEGSGVLEGVSRSFEFCLLGASDALDLTVPAGLLSSAPLSSPIRLASDFAPKLFVLSALAFRVAALGRLRTFGFSDASGGMKVPGPTDFLGAFGAGPVLLNELGGK